ncbi:Hypothetical protein SCF082_LOCUS11264 [Durusdinium trenchii]|uniref:Methyltransferase FkbM domain-containing protein n=1 Tax=Durusdinium trenchii TaxID=1381693 RepID=A0ABP0JC93_9DINO
MPKRKACPSLDADPCGIGLFYLTADEVNMIREKMDQMKRSRISGWAWVLEEATDTQRCGSKKRQCDTKETQAREATKAPEKAAAAKGKTPKAAPNNRTAKAKATENKKMTEKNAAKEAAKAAKKEAQEAKLAKAQATRLAKAAERTAKEAAAKASAKPKAAPKSRPAAKAKPKAKPKAWPKSTARGNRPQQPQEMPPAPQPQPQAIEVDDQESDIERIEEMASPLERCADQQEREYLLSLMVQISDDNKRRVLAFFREIVQDVDVHDNEFTLDFDMMTRRRRHELKEVLEHWAEEARTEQAQRDREEAEASAGWCGKGLTARCMSDLVEGFAHNVVKCSQPCQEQPLMNKQKAAQEPLPHPPEDQLYRNEEELKEFLDECEKWIRDWGTQRVGRGAVRLRPNEDITGGVPRSARYLATGVPAHHTAFVILQAAKQVPAQEPDPNFREAAPVAVAVAQEVYRTFRASFWAYVTIPVVAAVVGYGTNWVGVKMIFYPIEFLGVNIRRWPETPLGFIGWQGIVPCKTGKMSRRLVDIITEKLLSLKEAFSRLDAAELAQRLEPSVAYAIEHDAAWGEVWISVTRPQLRSVLTQLVQEMQKDIENLLDLRKVVSSAFLKDKVLLGELFQKAGRKELEFLVNSGLSFGFFLGILQMLLWICFPNNWVLPVGGALVGYITNWVAIKLIFDPVEPTQVGPFVFQGLFEKRQVEVSQEFSEFLADRVFTKRSRSSLSVVKPPVTIHQTGSMVQRPTEHGPQPPMLRAALVVAALAVAAAAADADCEEFSTLVAKQEKNDLLHTETKNDLMLLSSSGSSRYQVIFTDADAQELSSFLEGCHQIFLDVGSNRGTHVRKLFEPQKYKGARYLKVFERVFGPPSERQRNSSGICAIGFEPNSKWIPHHQDIERAYAKQGWKAKFFPVAVSDHVGRLNMFHGQKDNSEIGFGQFRHKGSGLSEEVQMEPFSEFISRINNTVPSGIRLVKMDIEGSEYEVLPDLLQKRMLCHDTIQELTIEWHSRFAELSNEKNKQLEKEVHSHNCSGSVPQTMVQNIDDESFMNDGQPLP